MPEAPALFVAIASYTDPELPRTLRNASAIARKPDALRFGICWQADSAAPVPLDPFRRDPRFRFIDRTIHESQGGPWARNLAQSLWRGEPYTLQIDSHMRFESAWDARLIEMLESLPSAKPIVTVNAPLFWHDDEKGLQRRFDMGVPTAKVASWSEAQGWAPWLDFGPPNRLQPGRTRFVSGGFVFTRGVWNVEVPQDPEHYYWGEEFSISVRSFTCGYDFFLPREVVAWHMLHRGGPPRRHWEQGPEVMQRRNATALARLACLLFGPDRSALGRYSLGRARALHEYEIYAGFDLARRRLHPDLLTGANPDPVTIRTEADWDRCATFAELQQRASSIPGQASRES